jgi:hypothetical protein
MDEAYKIMNFINLWHFVNGLGFYNPVALKNRLTLGPFLSIVTDPLHPLWNNSVYSEK